MANKTCVSLLSGGLDSLLVLRLMAMRGIRVIAMHSVNCFHGTQKIEEKKKHLARTALELGAEEIVFPDCTEDVVELTRHPRHGYGKHLNACIDCRLGTVRAGFDLMAERGADFVVTGEVVGQRPMSQRRDAIQLADRAVAEWGYPGLLLRPLCARLLAPTVPQREGWVADDSLFDFSGRGREGQMALAEKIGLGVYPTPAGGCLLTDPGFSQRLAVLVRYTPEWGANDVEMLKAGRPFQITGGARLIASRNERENYRLRDLSRADDYFYINSQRNGAIVLLRGEKTPEAERMAAGLAVYYSKMRNDGGADVERWRVENGADVDQAVFHARCVDPERVREMELALTGGNSLAVMRTAARKRS